MPVGDKDLFYAVDAGEVEGPFEGICRDAEQDIWFIPSRGFSGAVNGCLFRQKSEAVREARMQLARLRDVLDRKQAQLDSL